MGFVLRRSCPGPPNWGAGIRATVAQTPVLVVGAGHLGAHVTAGFPRSEPDGIGVSRWPANRADIVAVGCARQVGGRIAPRFWGAKVSISEELRRDGKTCRCVQVANLATCSPAPPWRTVTRHGLWPRGAPISACPCVWISRRMDRAARRGTSARRTARQTGKFPIRGFRSKCAETPRRALAGFCFSLKRNPGGAISQRTTPRVFRHPVGKSPPAAGWPTWPTSLTPGVVLRHLAPKLLPPAISGQIDPNLGRVRKLRQLAPVWRPEPRVTPHGRIAAPHNTFSSCRARISAP